MILVVEVEDMKTVQTTWSSLSRQVVRMQRQCKNVWILGHRFPYHAIYSRVECSPKGKKKHRCCGTHFSSSLLSLLREGHLFQSLRLTLYTHIHRGKVWRLLIGYLLLLLISGRIVAPHRATVTRVVVQNTGYLHSTRIEVCLRSLDVLFRSLRN